MSGLGPLQFVCFCFWLLTFSGSTCGQHAPIKVKEDSDVMLPCSISTNIELKLFVWIKDGQKEVFLYDAGKHYNNGLPGQDEQFKGRVSHFEDELKSGKASILIRNMKVADSGVYKCEFSHLPPERRIFHVQLVVVPVLKDRSGENIPGAAPEPIVEILKETNNMALLQCAVRGASPEPAVEWQDSAGNILPAEEQVSQSEGRYNIILQTTVNKIGPYHCVVTQKEINHQTRAETFVYISGTFSIESSTGWIVGGAIATLLVVVVIGFLFKLYKKQHSEISRLREIELQFLQMS